MSYTPFFTPPIRLFLRRLQSGDLYACGAPFSQMQDTAASCALAVCAAVTASRWLHLKYRMKESLGSLIRNQIQN